MMRLCPKCGDYYADSLLAFCLVDGTPLADVSPLSENWNKGVRVIEEKASALKKQQRKLKRRRALLSAMTMLIVAMVVCVLAAHAFIYLNPQQEESVASEPLRPATKPASLKDSIAPGGPGKPSTKPRPTASPKPTVTPTETKKNTPPRDPTDTPPRDTTDTTTPVLTLPPRSTILPPTKWPPSLLLPSVPACSEADQSREREIILRRFGEMWRQRFEGERSSIINGSAPQGAENIEARLGSIEYASTFSKACAASFVTARYVWRVTMNVNQTPKVVTVAKSRKFACVKVGGVWLCS